MPKIVKRVLPNRSILVGQKSVNNAKIEKIKCDILSDFQTHTATKVFFFSKLNLNFRAKLYFYFQPPIRSRSTPWWASRDPTHSGLLLVKLFDEGYSHDETRYAFLPTIGKRTKININSSADVQELINPLSSFLFPFFLFLSELLPFKY